MYYQIYCNTTHRMFLAAIDKYIDGHILCELRSNFHQLQPLCSWRTRRSITFTCADDTPTTAAPFTCSVLISSSTFVDVRNI